MIQQHDKQSEWPTLPHLTYDLKYKDLYYNVSLAYFLRLNCQKFASCMSVNVMFHMLECDIHADIILVVSIYLSVR